MTRNIKLAVVAGDGIGPEVVDQGLKTLDAALAGSGVTVTTTAFDLGAARWHRTGETLTAADLAAIREHDVILLGAVGDPGVPSGVLERGLLLKLRFELDQYVNLRPARLYPGVRSPLADPGEVDFVVVREGTEGPYAGNGGALRAGTPHEIATEVSLNTAFGVERVVRYAFATAQRRPRKHLTLVHKHNVLVHAGRLWQRIVDVVGAEFPDVTTDYLHVDDPLPEATGVHQDVVLVHQREVLAGTPLRGRKGVPDHALDPEGGVETHFGGDLVRRADTQRAAVAGVRAFGAFAHDDEVHLTGVGERGPDTRVEASRPQVHVLVELEPQLQQQTPLEDSGRDARVTDRAEQDDVVLADRGEVRGGERLAGPVPTRGAEVERCGRDGDVTSGEGGVERLEALIDDLRTDAVTCDDSELDVAGHSPTLAIRPMDWDGHLTC